MTTHESPTIGERYRKAITSSNIRPEARRMGDADLLIAAGWADSLGIKLYRLAGEFDQAARDLHRVSNKTDAIMVLGKLKTLTQARVALVGFAMDAAPRWGVQLDPNVTAVVVGRVLSAWLDPNCPKCVGTGNFGGYDGRVASRCTACSGTGNRRQNIGNNEHQRFFAQRLMAYMDSKLGEGDDLLRRYTRNA